MKKNIFYVIFLSTMLMLSPSSHGMKTCLKCFKSSSSQEISNTTVQQCFNDETFIETLRKDKKHEEILKIFSFPPGEISYYVLNHYCFDIIEFIKNKSKNEMKFKLLFLSNFLQGIGSTNEDKNILRTNKKEFTRSHQLKLLKATQLVFSEFKTFCPKDLKENFVQINKELLTIEKNIIEKSKKNKFK